MLQGLEQSNISINGAQQKATIVKWLKIPVNSQIIPLFCPFKEIIQIVANLSKKIKEEMEIWAIAYKNADIATEYKRDTSE